MVPLNDADLCALPAADLVAAMSDGSLTAEQLVSDCLARIAELDPTVQAWAYLDAEHALDQARRADAWRAAGRPLGPLHGVPVGVKDVIDTADMPTECGSPLCAGRAPRH